MTARDARNIANSVKWLKTRCWDITKVIEKEANSGEFAYIYSKYPFTYREVPKELASLDNYERQKLQSKFAEYFNKLGYKTKINDTTLIISWENK